MNEKQHLAEVRQRRDEDLARRVKQAVRMFDALSLAVYRGFHMRSILTDDDEAIRLASALVTRLAANGMAHILEGKD